MLRKILDSREVSCSREEDEIVWCGAKSGSYSVKVGLSLLEIEGRRKEWEAKLCGNNVCLLKAGAFTWLAGKRRILSGDRLKKMGFAGPFHYVLCEKAKEDVDHFLLNCDFAQEAWFFGLQRLNWKGPMVGNLSDWLESSCFGKVFNLCCHLEDFAFYYVMGTLERTEPKSV